MASLVHCTTLLSLLLLLVVLLNQAPATATSDDDNAEEYILDDVESPLSPSKTSESTKRSPYLKIIKKGMRCTSAYGNRYNICNGVSANKGTGILHCCKKHCRNVLSDKNNCGACLHKCRFGQRCCGGVCTNVISNPAHCGKCSRTCPTGVPCEYGVCGYA